MGTICRALGMRSAQQNCAEVTVRHAANGTQKSPKFTGLPVPQLPSPCSVRPRTRRTLDSPHRVYRTLRWCRSSRTRCSSAGSDKRAAWGCTHLDRTRSWACWTGLARARRLPCRHKDPTLAGSFRYHSGWECCHRSLRDCEEARRWREGNGRHTSTKPNPNVTPCTQPFHTQHMILPHSTPPAKPHVRAPTEAQAAFPSALKTIVR